MDEDKEREYKKKNKKVEKVLDFWIKRDYNMDEDEGRTSQISKPDAVPAWVSQAAP